MNAQQGAHHRRLGIRALAATLAVVLILLLWRFLSLQIDTIKLEQITPQPLLSLTQTLPKIFLTLTPNPSQTPTPIPIVDPPSSTQILLSRSPEPTPVREPDPRFAEFQKVYGLAVRGGECVAPCVTGLVNSADGKELTLAEFIARLGPPDKVLVFLYTGSGHRPGEIVVVLFYIKKGFSISASRPFDLNDNITPDMVGGRLDLFQSRTIDGIAMEMAQMIGGPNIWAAEDWKGFGPIKVHGR
jgi:hypothetical protein